MICKVILLLILLFIIYRLSRVEGFQDPGTIPKIIHQQGPKDINKWHPDWMVYRKTWLKHFPEGEYQHMLWDDESIHKMVENDYQWLLPYYDAMVKNIMRYDVSRLLMLHKYGGIYADLDMKVHRNFYDQLKEGVPNIVGSRIASDKGVQNSLMASPKGHPFWIALIADIIKNPLLYKEDKNMEGSIIINGTGPAKIGMYLVQTKEPFHELSSYKFNHNDFVIGGHKYATHKYTGSWKDRDKAA